METPRVVFFGSSSDSVLVLEKLAGSRLVTVVAVVTQPHKPVGRKQIPTPTPVELWAKKHQITVLSFPGNEIKPWLYADEQTVIDALQPLKADLLISASYGQKIPSETISHARYGGLNVHPSLLPRWRGADPVPWAILSGDRQTGVSIVTISETFDEGRILAQKKIPITDNDFSDPLRTKLFQLGAELLVETIPAYLAKTSVHVHPLLQKTYARRLTRDDGYEPWNNIQKGCDDTEEAARIGRKFRALTPWPGLWTTVTVHGENKRLKIIALTVKEVLLLQTVQLEGKNPVPFRQFYDAYLAARTPS